MATKSPDADAAQSAAEKPKKRGGPARPFDPSKKVQPGTSRAAKASEEYYANPENVGRPTKWEPRLDEIAMNLCLLGLNNSEIAKSFNISIDTFCEWQNKIKSFSEAIKAGREVADAKVARALFHKAIGFKHDSEEIKVIEGAVVRVPIVKQYAPDTGAAAMWLYNRRRSAWKPPAESSASGSFTAEQIAAILRAQAAEAQE